MVYYKVVKTTIDVSGLIEVIINIVVKYHGLSNSIISDCELLIISKFWSLVCYFLSINRKLFTTFYPQINGQTKKQNIIIEG